VDNTAGTAFDYRNLGPLMGTAQVLAQAYGGWSGDLSKVNASLAQWTAAAPVNGSWMDMVCSNKSWCLRPFTEGFYTYQFLMAKLAGL
jgi:hypothetical protein